MPPSRSSRTASARPSVGPSSSRATPGGGRKGGTGARASTVSASDLPAYEAPIAPLTRAAQHQLSTLPIKHDLSSLHSRLADAHERLAGAAADMHEMKTMRVEMAGVRAERQREKGVEADPADDERLEELVRRVDEMTARIEREVRRTVDREARMGESEEALRELSANQRSQRRAHAAATQTQATDQPPTQSEFGISQVPTETQMTDADENETAASLVEALRTRLKDAETKYDALTMRERYSAHNSYIAFRKMLHSAQYPDDAAAPPVPHASGWFDEASGTARQLKPSGGESFDGPTASQSMLPPPLPSQSGTQSGPGMDEDSEESDIEAVAERTSIKCPLTLQPMQQPVTSTKCPHSFERDAIMEYLSSGSTATGRRGRPRAAKCPVCEVILTSADLQVDRVLQRKIRRIQEAEARRREHEYEEDEEQQVSKAQLIGSSSPIRAPPGSGRTAARVKAERRSGVSRRREAMDVDVDEDD